MDSKFYLTSSVFILFLFALILDIISSRFMCRITLVKQRFVSWSIWGGASLVYMVIVRKEFYGEFVPEANYINFCIHLLSLSLIQFIFHSCIWFFIDTLLPTSVTSGERNELRTWGGLLSTVISIVSLIVCFKAIEEPFATVGMIISLIGLLFWVLADMLCFVDRLNASYKRQAEVLYKAIQSQLKYRFTINSPVILSSISIMRGWFLLLPVIAISVTSVFLMLAFSWLQIVQIDTPDLRHIDLFVATVFPVFAASVFVKDVRRSKRMFTCYRILSWLIGLAILCMSVYRFVISY